MRAHTNNTYRPKPKKMKTIQNNALEFEREMEHWTETWAVISSDPPVGKKLLQAIQAFVSVMTVQRLPHDTINRHLLNLWLLCGEIVRYAQQDEALKRLAPHELMLRFVDAEGGPYCARLASEQDQRSFQATCKILFEHLMMPSNQD